MKTFHNEIGKNIIPPTNKLNLLKYHLWQRRTELKNYFLDYDKLKKAKIPIDNFI